MQGGLLLAALAWLALAGCAPTALQGAAASNVTSTDAAAQAAPSALPAEPPAPVSPETKAAPSLACRSDADCAVKDVGSCCGYRPACVAADAQTFPEQVKAKCAAEGRMGICGFQPVSGCQCIAGQCAARPETIGPASPKALQ